MPFQAGCTTNERAAIAVLIAVGLEGWQLKGRMGASGNKTGMAG